MNVLEYFDRQKERILSRGIAARVRAGRTVYSLLKELNALEGLNVRERLAANAKAPAASKKAICLTSFQ